jgi:hypothetical protein
LHCRLGCCGSENLAIPACPTHTLYQGGLLSQFPPSLAVADAATAADAYLLLPTCAVIRYPYSTSCATSTSTLLICIDTCCMYLDKQGEIRPACQGASCRRASYASLKLACMIRCLVFCPYVQRHWAALAMHSLDSELRPMCIYRQRTDGYRTCKANQQQQMRKSPA